MISHEFGHHLYDPPWFGATPRAVLRNGVATTSSVPVRTTWLDDADSGVCARWVASTTSAKRSIPTDPDEYGVEVASAQRAGVLTRWTATSQSCRGDTSTATARGSMQIYVDGKRVATVSLRSSTTTHSRVVWTKALKAGQAPREDRQRRDEAPPDDRRRRHRPPRLSGAAVSRARGVRRLGQDGAGQT